MSDRDTPEPIDWKRAARVAKRVSGSDPFADSYHGASLQTDFAELTAQAEELVAVETGLRSLSGPAKAKVATREEWVDANIRSFQRLFAPMTKKLNDRLTGRMAPAARAIAGAEVGTLLGWMSKRVLGQYDLMIAPDENPEQQDMVYYVGPNVLSLEKRYGFAPREFRLWLALHEVTHRAQFTGVPWMRQHYLDLVTTTIDSADPDPKRFVEALKRATELMRKKQNPLEEGGIMNLLASPEQKVAIEAVGGLMSLLEGHGDVTMDRAGGGHVPSAERFSRVLSQRRAEVTGMAKVIRQLLGIEAKMKQYEQGEAFIHHVERERGVGFIDHAWTSSVHLPTLPEIREPQRWIERMSMLLPTAG
jgi:coenzyme F420 biosynthesis associated uncharacterized protein